MNKEHKLTGTEALLMLAAMPVALTRWAAGPAVMLCFGWCAKWAAGL